MNWSHTNTKRQLIWGREWMFSSLVDAEKVFQGISNKDTSSQHKDHISIYIFKWILLVAYYILHCKTKHVISHWGNANWFGWVNELLIVVAHEGDHKNTTAIATMTNHVFFFFLWVDNLYVIVASDWYLKSSRLAATRITFLIWEACSHSLLIETWMWSRVYRLRVLGIDEDVQFTSKYKSGYEGTKQAEQRKSCFMVLRC